MRKWTGERLETFIYNRDTIEHLHRYAIVNSYIKGKIVLDIASGEGYGSNLMSEKASFVYGVDIDDTVITLAKLKYKKNNIEFLKGTATKIPLKDNTIDVVVSFETIEHHDLHYEMLLEIKRVLKPNGIIIISTPDKLYYTDKRNINNHYHVKELYKNEFIDLLSFYFVKLQILNQKYVNGCSIIQVDKVGISIPIFTGNYCEVYEKTINPLYAIIIASDQTFIDHQLSIFDGGQVIENEIQKRVHKSITYRIGNFILFPIKFFRKLYRKSRF